MSAVVRALCAILLLLASGPAQNVAADANDMHASIVRIDSSASPTINVVLSVSDSRGVPVTGLDTSAFNLTEDGQPVVADRVSAAAESQQPLAIGLVIDVSGSMN